MYKLSTLQNGVRIMETPMPGTKTFSILVMVKTGSRHETKDNNGISHFVEHMFFKGTKRRPTTLAISGALDTIGGEFNAFTSKEYTGYYAKVDSRFAREAADVLGDMLLHSKFAAGEIERERGVIAEEVNMYENNPLIHIDTLFEQCVYGDTPAGWDTIGTRTNIARFRRKDFIDYVRTRYHGGNVIVGLAGRVTEKDRAFVKTLFVRLPASPKFRRSRDEGGPAGLAAEQNEYVYTTEQSQPQCRIKHQQTQQVSFSLGVRCYSYHHPDYYTAQLLAVILGGSMSSRLFISVRERAGLAYQVHTECEGYADSGYVTTTVGTSPDKLLQALEQTLKEYGKITRALVSAAELRRAKNYIKGKTVLRLESADNLNAWYVKQALLERRVLSPQEFFKLIERVRASDILRVARAIMKTAHLNLVAIGPRINERTLSRNLHL